MEFKAVTIVAVFIAIFVSGEVDSRPQASTDGWSQFYSRYAGGDQHRRAVNECETTSEVRELCQRCAKVTKSRLAYPMCCEMRENTRTWCVKFLNFGITPSNNMIDK